MPLRAAAAGVIRHQLHYVWNGELVCNVLHAWHPATPTQAMVDADRNAMTTWFTAQWRPIARSECQLRVIKSWSMETVPPTKFDDLNLYPLTPITGTMSADAHPMSVTVALSLRTGTVGQLPKPTHGRLYHVGGVRTDSGNDAGFGTQAAADTFATVYDNLRSAFTGAGSIGALSVVSYYLGGSRALKVPRAVPLVATVTRIKTDMRYDVQRRRMARQQSYVTN